MAVEIQRLSASRARLSIAHLTAIGFTLGSVVHLISLVMIGLGIYWYGLDYPAWRHVVMASKDAVIAWIAVRRPQWLAAALAALIVEETVVNGFGLLCVVVIAAIVAHVIQRSRAGAEAPEPDAPF